ncbi:MAG: hypothetical protein ABID38_07280 [Candidatus Diapherotrites archaeon]
MKKTHTEMIKRHGEFEIMPAYGVGDQARKQMKAREIKLKNRRYPLLASQIISKINIVKRRERAKRRV